MIRPVASAFGLYLGVALLATGAPPERSSLLGFGGDPESSVWFLRWWPWAVLHGADPFTSHLVYAPGGYSMAWATSVPTASLLAAPVTLLFGPVETFDALTLLAHPLAAGTGFLLAFEMTGEMAASLVAGFLFGFSGYENGQVLGHLNLDLVFLLPVAVLLAVRRARGRLGRGTFVAATGAVLAAQFGLSSEVFATSVLSGGLLLVVLLARARDRGAMLRIGVECVAATAFALVLISPMLVGMARHAREMPDFVNAPGAYSNDLLNLVVPTRAEALHDGGTEAIAARFGGNGEEQDLYLGLPLLAIVLGFAVRSRGWRSSVAVTIGLLALASLGPRLHVAGTAWPVRLPWAAVEHLPLLRAALPCRLGVYVALGSSVAAACWMAERGRRWARTAAGLLACVFLLPGWARASWTPVQVPSLFSDPRLADGLAGGNVLLLPFTSGDTMLWQAVSGMRFAQAGGLLSFIPLGFQHEKVALSLVRNEAEAGFVVDLLAFARRHEVRLLVEGTGTGASIRAALGASGWRLRRIGGVTVVEVGVAR